ncbi:hypothetical protein OS493_000529 [Desmophyllum pertusum]|uniref:Uncharacterized protein n=1 Tax=Desmophyllum pertusum TaxID=174260 RepID=A0A9X0A7Q0_9CNID|nr:hypothetical protein OS493_000529 [Desmophyllum pertusum]
MEVQEDATVAPEPGQPLHEADIMEIIEDTTAATLGPAQLLFPEVEEEEVEDEVLFRDKEDDNDEDEGMISNYESDAEMTGEMPHPGEEPLRGGMAQGSPQIPRSGTPGTTGTAQAASQFAGDAMNARNATACTVRPSAPVTQPTITLVPARPTAREDYLATATRRSISCFVFCLVHFGLF